MPPSSSFSCRRQMTSSCGICPSDGIFARRINKAMERIVAGTDQALFQMHQKAGRIGEFPPPASFWMTSSFGDELASFEKGLSYFAHWSVLAVHLIVQPTHCFIRKSSGKLIERLAQERMSLQRLGPHD